MSIVPIGAGLAEGEMHGTFEDVRGRAVTLRLTPVLGIGTLPEAAGLQFSLDGKLGGGQGRHAVHVGTDHQLNTPLAYKRIPKGIIALQPTFFREARLLHQSRHRHVVPIMYACEDSDYVYLAMPLFERGSLQTLLQARCLTTREIIRLGLDVLMAMHHAHISGVLHLDIEPDNIFIDDSGAALLADFGQSRDLFAGTVADIPDLYLRHTPPEIGIGGALTIAADVFQFGLTLYRMSMGDHAWQSQVAEFAKSTSSAQWEQIRKGTFPVRGRLPEHIPSRLAKVVHRAIDVDVDRRFSTSLAMLEALASVADDPRLDWQPAPLTSGGMEWIRALERSVKRVQLIHDGNHRWHVEVRREGRSPARLASECRPASSEAAARAHVRRLLAGAPLTP